MKMDREDAIDYLGRKYMLSEQERKLTKKDEKLIREVMKKGKIYGDPVAMVE